MGILKTTKGKIAAGSMAGALLIGGAFAAGAGTSSDISGFVANSTNPLIQKVGKFMGYAVKTNAEDENTEVQDNISAEGTKAVNSVANNALNKLNSSDQEVQQFADDLNSSIDTSFIAATAAANQKIDEEAAKSVEASKAAILENAKNTITTLTTAATNAIPTAPADNPEWMND